MKEFVTENGREKCPDLVVLHGNTLLENPVIHKHSVTEIANIRAFAKEQNLPISVEVATPSTSEDYLVNILGGRTIASVAQTSSRKCAMMMKVQPVQRLKRNILKRLNRDYEGKVLTLIGKRYDESASRKADMLSSGELPHTHIERGGENILCSIANFTLDDIYWVIGMVRSDMIKTYSCFTSLVETYRAANGGECLVNASEGKAGGAGCGARYGCHICLQNEDDKSMETMLEEEEFAYMRPLWDFRNYLQAYHNDPSKRCWLARKVDLDGNIKIQPNSYSPEFTEELLRMALSIQAQEDEQSWINLTPPRFTLITFEQVLAIELQWLRYGYHRGLQALRIWNEVMNEGKWLLPPSDKSELPRFPLLNDVPDVSVPFVDDEYNDIFSGFRSLEHAVADIESVVEKQDGRVYANVLTDDEFTINTEELYMFMDYELEYALRKYNHDHYAPGAALHYLLNLGVVSLYKGSHSEYDRMLRMSNAIHRQGLRPHLNDPAALVEKMGTADQEFKLDRLF